MLFYIIIFSAVFIPYIANERYKGLALIVSMCLLFIPWGLQYEMVHDWESNIGRWVSVNGETKSLIEIKELIFIWILQICKPLSFFGYLIVCAVVELLLFYYLIRKYVPSTYYWLSVFVLIIPTNMGLLFINSNRQTISIVFTIIAILFLKKLDSNKITQRIKAYFIAVILLLVAANIHSAAYASLLLIPIYYYASSRRFINTSVVIYVCNILFFLRFIIPYSFFESLESLYLLLSDNGMEVYVNRFEKYKDMQAGFFQLFPYWIIMNALVFFYNYQTKMIRFFSIALVFAIIMLGFFKGTLSRLLEYYYVYAFIVIPYYWATLKKIRYSIIIGHLDLTKCVGFLLLCVMVYYFYGGTIVSPELSLYGAWSDFRTIFSASKWM